MEFDPAIALEHAQRISRPRKVGSREEKVVAQEIKAYLEYLGFRVDYQPFRFSTASEVSLFLEILTGLAMIIATLLALGINPWLTSIQAGFLVILIIVIGPLNNKVQCSSLKFEHSQPDSWWSILCWNVGKWYETRNIVARLPDSPIDPEAPHLYLVAHYDSKSQYLPLVVRIALFVILIAGTLIFASLTLLSLFNDLFIPLSIVVGIAAILSGIPLLFLDYGDDSPGAIDDASGVGLVLHLAEVIANQPNIKDEIGITVLITSAEELAVKGAQAYVAENESSLNHQIDNGGLYVLNFDGIGVEGKIHLVGGNSQKGKYSGEDLSNLIMQSAKELDIPVGRFSLPGALFDHIPFSRAGYDALSLIGIGKSSLVVHSEKDSKEMLHVNGFEQAGRLGVRVVEKICGDRGSKVN